MEKKELADRFTKDLYLREREAKQMQFYVDYFPKWKHEGMDREDEEAILFQQLCKQQAEANEKERKRQERIDLIENDRLKLEDDKQMTEGVERIMLRYGTLHYSNQTEFTDDERINRIFKKSKDYNKKKKQVQIQEQEKKDAAAASMRSESVEELMDMPKTARSQASEFTYSTEATDFTISTVDKLLLQLDSKANLEELYRDLRKNKHKRGKSTKYKNPFANKSAFFDTGDVTKVKGYHIKEVGAMAFAIELSTGLCPLLEEVCLKDCQMYDDGFGRVIQGMKTANLYTLRVMDVRGNFLTHKALDYMYEISKAGIFSSLEVFNLANNELGDDGIDSLSRILMIYTLQNLKEIHFQRNRVTDHGFQKIVKVMMAIQPEHYPQFHRLGLENNVVSSFVKQELAPIPFYVSV